MRPLKSIKSYLLNKKGRSKASDAFGGLVSAVPRAISQPLIRRMHAPKRASRRTSRCNKAQHCASATCACAAHRACSTEILWLQTQLARLWQ
jgi:hypothetical protein